MTGQELLELNLSRWLEPAGVALDNERIPLYLAAVREMGDDLKGRELDAVRAAHGDLNDAIRSWVGDAMRSQDQGFVAEGRDALLTRLVAVSVLHALVSSTTADVILVNLAIESARFLRLNPVVADLSDVSANELLETARQVRERADVPASAAAIVARLPGERKPDEDNDQAVTAEDLANDVFAHAKAVRALASRVDDLAKAYADRQAALDEEVEILWWVLLGRDRGGTRWADHPPLVRAVKAAQELRERTLRLPGPPSAGYFLSQALGDDDAAPATIAGLAEAGAQMENLPSAHDSLLPITAAVQAYREVDGNSELWPALAESKFGIPVGREITLGSAAAQLYRELEMLDLLPT